MARRRPKKDGRKKLISSAIDSIDFVFNVFSW